MSSNVIDLETSDGKEEVSAIDPIASMQVVDNPALGEIATQIRAKLQTVLNNI